MLWGDEDSARVTKADPEQQAKLAAYRRRVCREGFAWADAMLEVEVEDHGH